MNTYPKEEDISKHLPQAFCLFGIETDLEAIEFLYFFRYNQNTYCSASE